MINAQNVLLVQIQNCIGHFAGKSTSLNKKDSINQKWKKLMLLLSLGFSGKFPNSSTISYFSYL